MSRVALIALTLPLVLAVGEAGAVPIGVGDFSGSETLIDFDSLANGVSVTNQFAGLGVTFNGPTAVGFLTDFVGNSDPIVLLNNTLDDTIELMFSTPVNRVGAFSGTAGPVVVTLTIYDDLDQVIEFVESSFTIPDGGIFPEGFLGLESSVDIARAVFSDSGGTVVIDDLRFEATSVGIPDEGTTAPIPEPSSAVLFGFGALVVAGRLRTRARG